MAKYNLISAAEAREHVQSDDALLVCAYESEEKFKNACLEGAISLQDFKAREGATDKNREIIFYFS
jgi:hypothetical protein